MLSTMMDVPLSLSQLLRHGQTVHGRSRVQTWDGSALQSRSFAEVGERAERLAAGLRRLGVAEGDRVGTFMWNNVEHLEAYLAVPSMGAVLHTLNVRLFPDQLTFVVNEAEDAVIVANTSVAPLLAKVFATFTTVEHVVLVDDGPLDDEVRAALGSTVDYEELLADGEPGFEWPELDERQAAVACYTSGTTGDPKGVVYSHRSTILHALNINNAGGISIGERDRALIVVPMFHVNAWGFPLVCWMTGADLVMPSRFLQGAPIAQIIETAEVTHSSGVPTVWAGLLAHVREHPDTDLSSVKLLISGGSALPRSMVEAYDKLGVHMIQGWGMTETSPLCGVSEPPAEADPEDVDWRVKSCRVVPGVALRIVTDDGTVAPWDGTTTGEVEVRGPYITGSYVGGRDADRFHDGWLRTGDIGSMDDRGYLVISDRVKDVIKSGGEWVSSVDLENQIMSHPDVLEASVIGVPDDHWGERPLAAVVLRSGSSAGAEDIQSWLADKVAKFWLPERWAFIDEVPKTSVGKFDKKTLRQRHADGDLEVVDASPAPS